MEKIMDSEYAKINAYSSVIVASIVSIGVIIAAVILAGGDYGRTPIPCMNANTQGALKAMPNSTEMEVMIMRGNNTEIGIQRAKYDYHANMIVVETPAIEDAFNNASIHIDYERSVVFIKIYEEDHCYASALSGDMVDMADRSINFMRHYRERVIDISQMDDKEINYYVDGLIPAGYVTNSNGPIIRALCAGEKSYWTKPRMTNIQMQSRKKRRSGRASVRFCVIGICFNINL